MTYRDSVYGTARTITDELAEQILRKLAVYDVPEEDTDYFFCESVRAYTETIFELLPEGGDYDKETGTFYGVSESDQEKIIGCAWSAVEDALIFDV